MLIRLTPVIAITLLSGCSMLSSKQYHQQTIDSINASNESIRNEMTNISLAISNQSDYIESLEEKIEQLSQALESSKQETIAALHEQPSPIVVPAPAQVVVTQNLDFVLGEVEKVRLDAIDQSFDARIDTGAVTSSLNAVDIEEFERNGEQWVRFHLDNNRAKVDEQQWIEAPVIRFVKIRQSTTNEVERRAVIELWIKLGKIHEKAQFTLADRSQMSHPVLIGREFIRDIAVVDVSKKYIHTDVPQNNR
jgi:hypothetical protein